MGEVNGVARYVVICVKGLGRGEGRVLQALMIIINIFIFTVNKIGSIWTLWLELLQSVLREKNRYFFLPVKRDECLPYAGTLFPALGMQSDKVMMRAVVAMAATWPTQSLTKISASGLGCRPWSPDLPFHPHSSLLPGLPIKHVWLQARGQGARTMKLLDIGFAGLGMEQRGWVWIWKNN